MVVQLKYLLNVGAGLLVSLYLVLQVKLLVLDQAVTLFSKLITSTLLVFQVKMQTLQKAQFLIARAH